MGNIPPDFSTKYIKEVKKRLKENSQPKCWIKFPSSSYKTGRIDPDSLVVKR